MDKTFVGFICVLRKLSVIYEGIGCVLHESFKLFPLEKSGTVICATFLAKGKTECRDYNPDLF